MTQEQMDIDTEIKEINEKQAILVDLMTQAADRLSNDLKPHVTSDVRKHLRELGRLIEIHDSNADTKTELLYEKEKQSMFNQYKYVRK